MDTDGFPPAARRSALTAATLPRRARLCATRPALRHDPVLWAPRSALRHLTQHGNATPRVTASATRGGSLPPCQSVCALASPARPATPAPLMCALLRRLLLRGGSLTQKVTHELRARLHNSLKGILHVRHGDAQRDGARRALMSSTPGRRVKDRSG